MAGWHVGDTLYPHTSGFSHDLIVRKSDVSSHHTNIPNTTRLGCNMRSCKRSRLPLIFLLLLECPRSNLFAQDLGPAIDSLAALAERQLAVGQIDSARNNFDAVLDLDKKDVPARIGLGKTYFAENNLE